MKNKHEVKFILKVFLIWNLFIFLVSLVAPVIAQRPQFSYNDGPQNSNPRFLWGRANFDGIHYLQISRNNSYGLHQQAFFPLYPKLIRFLTPFFLGSDLLAGLFISNISLLVFLFFLYKLILLDFSEKVAQRAVVLVLAFPASLFLGTVYTESLFLALVTSSFYLARKRNWLAAGILGALAAYTRISGIFLFPAFIWEFYQQKKGWNLLPILLVPLGLLSYMRFLGQRYGDPLLFVHVQPYFGAERSGGKVILLYQVFWRYLKMILTTKWDPLYFVVWLELLTAVGFLFLLIWSFKKKINTAYLIFAALSYILPTLSGTFSSLPRYALTFFPCFILLGTIKNSLLSKILVGIFGTCLAVSSVLFFRGYWIS
jgi:Gpi18-like mannosyltransferase